MRRPTKYAACTPASCPHRFSPGASAEEFGTKTTSRPRKRGSSKVLNRRRFKSQAEAKMAVFDWLEGRYNPHRRHSALGRRSPVNYERHALQCEVART